MSNEVVNELEEVEMKHLRKLPKLKNEFRYVICCVCWCVICGVFLDCVRCV